MSTQSSCINIAGKKARSYASIRRERLRSSPNTILFRQEILSLLEFAEPDVSYSIKRDLKTMTHMPFYGEKIIRVKSTKNKIEMIKSYIELLSSNSNMSLSIKLLAELSKNQSQTFRKAAKRYGIKKDIWEHVIPCKFVVSQIITMIEHNDFSNLDSLLRIYEKAGQRSLTHDENKLLKPYHICMPDGWDWTDANAEPLARYKKVGLLID